MLTKAPPQTLTGLTSTVRTICNVGTLAEQRDLWPSVRRVLLSWPLHRVMIASEWWAWKAGGVPKAQRDMIVADYMETHKLTASQRKGLAGGQAIWEYVVNTFDPAVASTLLSTENYFYYLCLRGQYGRKCHPRYLGPRAYAKLSKPGAFDGVRIHTDALMEVVERIRESSLTIAVLMDSMDWFEPGGGEAGVQVRALWRVLKIGGRVLFRSASLRPWYVRVFQEEGFRCECVGRRTEGKCIDRLVCG